MKKLKIGGLLTFVILLTVLNLSKLSDSHKIEYTLKEAQAAPSASDLEAYGGFETERVYRDDGSYFDLYTYRNGNNEAVYSDSDGDGYMDYRSYYTWDDGEISNSSTYSYGCGCYL